MGRSNGREVQMYPPLKEVYIELFWNDIGETRKRFANVHELAQFLKDNPVLANAVGYVASAAKLNLKMPDNLYTLPFSEQRTLIENAYDVLSRKGSVEYRGMTFKSEFEFERFMKEIKNRR